VTSTDAGGHPVSDDVRPCNSDIDGAQADISADMAMIAIAANTFFILLPPFKVKRL